MIEIAVFAFYFIVCTGILCNQKEEFEQLYERMMRDE